MHPATEDPDFQLASEELSLEKDLEEEDEDEDEDLDEEDEFDDEDNDEDEDDEDDDVGTDENGNEMLRVRAARPAPDVGSDRVPATDAEPEGSLDPVKRPPLGIREIENLEDDAKGG